MPRRRRLAVHHRVVLVGCRDDREPAAVPDEPRPPRAEPLDAGVANCSLNSRSRRTAPCSRHPACRPARRRRLPRSTPRTASGSRGRRRCCAPPSACPQAGSRGSRARLRSRLDPLCALEGGVEVRRRTQRDACRDGSPSSARRCAARARRTRTAARVVDMPYCFSFVRFQSPGYAAGRPVESEVPFECQLSPRSRHVR